MAIINLHRPSLTVNVENVLKKFPNFGKISLRHTTRGLIRGLIQTVKMNMTMETGPQT